jgi:uncharacterized membrane protein
MRAATLQKISIALLLALAVLGLTWELWLAPLRPGGSWLVLKVIPLLLPLRGLLHGRRYTFQWLSLLIWLYFTEGVVRASSDQGLSAVLGGIETLLSVGLFSSVAAYSRVTAPSRQAKASE